MRKRSRARKSYLTHLSSLVNSGPRRSLRHLLSAATEQAKRRDASCSLTSWSFCCSILNCAPLESLSRNQNRKVTLGSSRGKEGIRLF